MHIFPFSFASPESEGAHSARRRSVIACLEAMMRAYVAVRSCARRWASAIWAGVIILAS